MTIYLVFVLLAILMALIMRWLGNEWWIMGHRVVAWPFYAAWGVGWTITALYLSGDLSIAQWLKIWALFSVVFPFIVWGAQGGRRASTEEQLRSIAEAVDRITNGLSKIVIWPN